MFVFPLCWISIDSRAVPYCTLLHYDETGKAQPHEILREAVVAFLDSISRSLFPSFSILLFVVLVYVIIKAHDKQLQIERESEEKTQKNSIYSTLLVSLFPVKKTFGLMVFVRELSLGFLNLVHTLYYYYLIQKRHRHTYNHTHPKQEKESQSLLRYPNRHHHRHHCPCTDILSHISLQPQPPLLLPFIILLYLTH